VIGIFLTALLFALTLGSSGESGRGFLRTLRQAEGANIGLALLGGAVFNAANILLGAAISIAGMSVAFPVGIGLALVLGVLVNYADNPVGIRRCCSWAWGWWRRQSCSTPLLTAARPPTRRAFRARAWCCRWWPAC
jgi:hypothetical protein